MATVSPSFTRISARTPAAGAGISASTLSVEISKIGSSRFTSSPTFFNHLESVPSAIDSPICGMMMSTRATASPSFAYSPGRVRLRRLNAITGSVIAPTAAPIPAYTHQLHAGSPSGGLHPCMLPTNFATSTAIIPPLKNPATVVTHPTPMLRATTPSRSGAGTVISRRQACAAPSRCRTSAAARSPRAAVNKVAARQPPSPEGSVRRATRTRFR